ncbi:MAG: carbonic anhydrase [Candidatus Angelobacter sp.]|jgi:carbonic anhydrase|nr:carbonic anhydrase [Candidatus Angelobacter sp.]
MKRALLSCTILVVFVSSGAAQQPSTAPVQQPQHHARTDHQPRSATEIWADLMDGNRRYIAGHPKARQLVALRNSVARDQHPEAVVLACSDSRVAPEILFDKSLGDLFVVRSAGNIADAIGVGSIEYAVEHLGSSVLVIMGHTKCGAVTAACSREKMPTSNLQAIVDKIDPAVLQAERSAKGDALVEVAIKDNVHQSAKDVLANSEVLRHFVEQGKLTVFEAEYQLDTGAVVRLNGPQQ